jgi:hypothetical protein
MFVGAVNLWSANAHGTVYSTLVLLESEEINQSHTSRVSYHHENAPQQDVSLCI